jgi:hypothetical protein
LRVIALAFGTLAVAASAGEVPPSVKGLENARSLGHGFWLVTIAEEMPKDFFESIGHFQYCYFQKTNLGQCGDMSASPSGTYAVYQVAKTGLIMLFDSRTGRSRLLTHRFSGLLEKVSWSEQTRSVSISTKPRNGATKSFVFTLATNPAHGT